MLEEAEPDALSYLDFLPTHWKRLRTNNVRGKTNRWIKRRPRVVQVSPSTGSLVRSCASRMRCGRSPGSQRRLIPCSPRCGTLRRWRRVRRGAHGEPSSGLPHSSSMSASKPETMTLTGSLESLETAVYSATHCILQMLAPVAYISAMAATRARSKRW